MYALVKPLREYFKKKDEKIIKEIKLSYFQNLFNRKENVKENYNNKKRTWYIKKKSKMAGKSNYINSTIK